MGAGDRRPGSVGLAGGDTRETQISAGRLESPGGGSCERGAGACLAERSQGT